MFAKALLAPLHEAQENLGVSMLLNSLSLAVNHTTSAQQPTTTARTPLSSAS
jgi:hypothetical protein